MTSIENLEWLLQLAIKSKQFSIEMSKELKERLEKEIEVVSRENCAEMYNLATALFGKARRAKHFIEISPAGGHGLSLLCYFLNISSDNPLLYRDYDSFTAFERELATHKIITVMVADSGLTEMKDLIQESYPDTEIQERTDSFEAKIPGTDDYAGFTIHASVDYEAARRERVLDCIQRHQMKRICLDTIPLDDKSAYILFNGLDWDGVTCNLVFTKVMQAVKERQPHSIKEIWECINTPIYQVSGTREGEPINLESFVTAVRMYHLAYLKAHFKAEFDVSLEKERLR